LTGESAAGFVAALDFSYGRSSRDLPHVALSARPGRPRKLPNASVATIFANPWR
jgi:hypothetical protein